MSTFSFNFDFDNILQPSPLQPSPLSPPPPTQSNQPHPPLLPTKQYTQLSPCDLKDILVDSNFDTITFKPPHDDCKGLNERDLFVEPTLRRIISLSSNTNTNTSQTKDVHDLDLELDQTSDLIPGVYEGGLKVWECAVDLCGFLFYRYGRLNSLSCNNDGNDPILSFLRNDDGDDDKNEKTVNILELGCGHSLPSLALLKILLANNANTKNKNTNNNFSIRITLSDYNAPVFPAILIPNILLNFPPDILADGNKHGVNFRFYGGDWMGLPGASSSTNDYDGDKDKDNSTPSSKYTLILASETTYTTSSCTATSTLIAQHLSQTGVAMISLKRYYFGVGGGILELEKELGKMGLEVVEGEEGGGVVDGGKGNIREVVVVRWRRE